ncbi:hypothetical protein Poly30_35950 [Planctomycetes bacterium Poly30]|uniref:Outer membrane protein assembly factor BamD n=1 Tax=Saltatorellus ferox TaxID=2528018 RepID=A0A518EVD2_9BACT|nr:hypothetical protein Poly30_35950 [Planctomycetes bacterium Poly30]
MRILLALLASLSAASCASTSVQTFSSPEEATNAIVAAAEQGNQDEARRIFDSFARSSVQRDKVYASLFSAAEARYDRGNGGGAANILQFVTTQYPAAAAAREALVYSLFVERAGAEAPAEGQAETMAAAIESARSVSSEPSAWIDLAATQVAIDRGDLSGARAEFGNFLDAWDGQPASLLPYVEDIDRYLQSH